MDRREELIKIFDNADAGKRTIVLPLIDDVVYMESRLVELRKLPFIMVKPDDPTKQKPTPASKLYKETLQQYNNSIKLLCSLLSNSSSSDEVSPLREYMRRFSV
ncbi:MAG: hypothetical protein MJY71_08170 [Bacteroidaceae bacterium]|nr:hypothetical protein [Bacteroidaceae bacterium]